MKTARYYLVGLILLAGAAQPTRAQADDPALLRTFEGHTDWVRSVAFSPDGRQALSGSSDNTLKLWETASGRLVRTFEGHSGWVRSVAFSPDGRQALSGSWDNTLKLWETASGRLVRTFEGHTGYVRSVAFSPDGRYALSGSDDNTLKLWETASGRLVRTFEGHTRYAMSVAFSPDGRLALSGSGDNTLKLWETASGRLARTFEGHTDWVYSVAFSPDGRYVLSGSFDNTLKLWETAGGRLVRTFEGHTNWVRSVAFSPDGRLALSGSDGNTLKLWDISPWTKPDEKPLAETPAQFAAAAHKELEQATSGTKPKGTPGSPYNSATKPAAKADKTPPSIQITSPAITRGMKKVQQEKTILVKGRATDKSGIFEVLVNGVEAQVGADGSFWAEVKLAFGENRIAVQAIDMKENSASTAFTVVRETGAKAPPVVAARTKQQEEFQFGEYHALLIAVQDYADGSINDLEYPIQDARKVKAVLQKRYTFEPENIHVLENPDRRDIFRMLGELNKRLRPKDNLLIFYAGHGYWDEDFEQGYWLPRDARMSDRADWISNSTVKDYIKGIKTKHSLLISDACFSGGIFRTRDVFIPTDIAIQEIYKLPSRRALTSGTLKTVPDKSVFVKYLVQRLEENRESYLHSDELFHSMKKAVIRNSLNVPQSGVINGAGDEGGDFIFVRRR